jgi:serine/threonine kinase PknH
MRTRMAMPLSEHGPRLAAGSHIAGYRVERVVRERRGRSTLAEATTPDGKPVALVVFSPSVAADDMVRDRVARLARLRAANDAPLLPLVGAGERDGCLYVARAMPRATTLADRLREGPLNRRETVRLLSQVAGALETLREFDLPHGHLTPGGILLSGRGQPQALLCDYGFAPPQGRACERADLVEQADYLAPEAVLGNPSDPGSTIYALACVLVECLTGAPPFPRERPLLVLDAHLTEAPPSLSERVDVPAALDDIVRTALHKRVEQRPRSAGGFMKSVQRALGIPMPIPVVQPPAPPRARRAAAAASERPVLAVRADTAAPAPPPAKPWPEPTRAEARKARSAKPARRIRRSRLAVRWPAPTGVALGLALIASTAGFAAGNLGGTDGNTGAQRSAVADQQRARYVRAVDGAVDRLDTRRAAALQRLREAGDARAQARAATGLAAVYRDTRSALPRAPRGVAAPPLHDRLLTAERAYRRLAAAARRKDAAAFRAARADVLRSENAMRAAVSR